MLNRFLWALSLVVGGYTNADDWSANEAPRLKDAQQLTFSSQFVRAGEAYFSPDGKHVIFQGVEKPAEGQEASPFYAMYTADLVQKDGKYTLENTKRISPVGSANTCGWFDPMDGNTIYFASTIVPPSNEETPGYQRGTGRYKWAFPKEMRIVKTTLSSADGTAASLVNVVGSGDGYVAEGSTSPDGRSLVYCRILEGDAQIYMLDLKTGRDLPLVTNRGYDGGPFFSPDGKRICYRSDRDGSDLLQLFVADLAFGPAGEVTGITTEHQLTKDDAVNWGPYWHTDGKSLFFASSRIGHDNYEVFEIQVPATGSTDTALATPVRVTFAPGADVLPVVDRTGRLLVWTSKRSQDNTAQMWIAQLLPAKVP
ncbi:MAG: hypothetical protein O2800_02535 [Planctomycetota bacterium]|nr:hypothetical protein [Planctomycetota bacterium]